MSIVRGFFISVFLVFFVSVFHTAKADDTQVATGEEIVEDDGISGIDGITKPVSDIELSFVQSGKIEEILVREGDVVGVGDFLISQDDEIEQIQLKILKARSQNRVPVQLAEVELSQKQKDLQKLKNAWEKGATTEWEVDHAELAADTALLSLKIREFDQDQDSLKLQSLIESIKNLTIKSPVSGVVEDIRIQAGETVQALHPVIRIVKTDPLIIDLAVPVDEAVRLEPGRAGEVFFIDGSELRGEVVKVSSVADAAATTLEVQLKVPNPDSRPAGERVRVMFEK